MDDVDKDWLDQRRSPLAEKLGMEFLEASEGTATMTMPFDPANTTIDDVVHGGAILSLADSVATAAIWSSIPVKERGKYRGLTIDLSLSFVSAARGTDMVGKAKLLKRGNSICFAEVEIVTAAGVLVAKAKVAYKLSKIRVPNEIDADGLALAVESNKNN